MVGQPPLQRGPRAVAHAVDRQRGGAGRQPRERPAPRQVDPALARRDLAVGRRRLVGQAHRDRARHQRRDERVEHVLVLALLGAQRAAQAGQLALGPVERRGHLAPLPAPADERAGRVHLRDAAADAAAVDQADVGAAAAEHVRAAHRDDADAVGGDAERPAGERDDVVGAPEDRPRRPSLRRHRPRVLAAVRDERLDERVRPAERRVDAGLVGARDAPEQLVVADALLERRGGSAGRPLDPAHGRVLRSPREVDAEGDHGPRP
ncbi:MAG TPA: hypothetical protein VHF89_02555 [Solirubrobacteraceae bacterium]|nr:hypothetical protein [Solirubrobacteraceae bacterium]